MIKIIYKGIIGLAVGGSVVGGVTYTDNQINTYTDKIDRMELSLIQNIPESGESKIELLKARPEMRLKKWNGEVDLGVSYSKVKGQGNRPLLSNKMEWKNAKEEVHAYPIDNDNFEFEVVLKEKPDTNVFDFTIDGYENLDFFYQPALTQTEIDEGAIRPDNVIGSYAVYHKTKANHRVGSTNYETGKAFHIYRPQAIDANGVKTWAELDYINGILSVKVPQIFLDNAIYPVKVDPTLGYATQGASSASIEDTILGSHFLTTEITNVVSFNVFINNDTSTKGILAAIYNYTSDSDASSLVKSSHSGLNMPITSGVQRSYTYFDPVYASLSANTNYFFVLWSQAGTGAHIFYYDTVTTTGITLASTFGTYPDPMTGETGTNNKFSVYANYYASNTYVGTVGSDSGFCYNLGSCFTGISNPDSNVRIGFRTGAGFGDIMAGFRFSNVNIPKNATINTATLTYIPFDTDATTDNVFIYTEAVDNSPTFTTTGADSPRTVSYGGSRATSTNKVSWTLPNQTTNVDVTSPDISSVIQEVVNRAGWVSGNALSIIIGNNAAADNHNARSATSTAYLTITFTELSPEEYIINFD